MSNSFDPQDHFPNMTPISGPPPLFTVNGCGLNMYGRRDYDEDTRTYVSTLCICLIFIPIIPIAAYRVSTAPEGWYFHGKVPMSGFAHCCSLALGLCAMLAIATLGWLIFTDSPFYRDWQKASQAEALLEKGDKLGAVRVYRPLYFDSSSQKAAAGAAMKRIFESCQAEGPTEDSLKVLNILEIVDRRTKGTLLGDMSATVADHCKLCLKDNPKLGLQYVILGRKLSNPPKGLDELRQQLLVRANQLDPQDLNVALELVAIYEKEKALDKCEKVLLPLKDKLGDSEGARILGTILLRQGKYDDAYGLLQPYVTSRMDALKMAEKRYENETNRASKRALRELNSNPNSKAYRRIVAIKDEDAQGKAVDEYLWKRIRNDGSVKSALEKYREAAAFVPAALDLGMLQLNRAQAAGSATARQKELEAAERTFVSIRGVAAGSATYQLTLGEVYYWLGKDAQGKTQFDTYLTNNKRSAEALLEVAQILRRLGHSGAVYDLAKEAFGKTKKKGESRDSAVFLLSQTCGEIEEKIDWLEKGDTNNVNMQIDLNTAKSELAKSKGEDAKAVQYLTKVVASYEKMPQNEAILNNQSLAYSSLYDLTGDPEYFSKSTAMIGKAVELNPRGPILLRNAVTSLFKDAVIRSIRDRINLKEAKQEASSDLLSYLYRNDQEKRALYQQLSASSQFQKAEELCRRLYVLSPKSISNYMSGMKFARFRHSLKDLKDVDKRLTQAKLDYSDYETYARELYAGTRREQQLSDAKSQLKKYRAVLKSISREKSPLSYAIVATILADLERERDELEPRGRQNEIVKLSQEAYRCAPSAATRNNLVHAYAYRACCDLMGRNSALKRLRLENRNALGAYSILAFAAVADKKLAGQIAANADIKQILGLIRDTARSNPDNLRASDWALTKGVDPKLADEVKRCVLADKYGLSSHAINFKHFSYLVDARLQDYFLWLLKDRPEEAERVARQTYAMQLPFPKL